MKPRAKKAGGKRRKTVKKKTTAKRTAGKKRVSRQAAAARIKKAPWREALKASQLIQKFNPAQFSFKDTSELEALNEIVGQDRALKALRLGVDLFASGYNIYVSGMSGTGKMSTVKRLLDQLRPRCPTLRDFLYVYNFKVPNKPVLITLPCKMGREFATRMGRLFQILQEELPTILSGEGILDQKEALAKQFLDQQKELFTTLEKELKRAGLVLSQVKIGSVIRPEVMIPVGENAYPFEQLTTLVELGKVELNEGVDLKKLEETYNTFRQGLREVMKRSRGLNATMVERLEALEKEIAAYLIGGTIEDLQEEYKDHPKIVDYLTDYKEHVLSNLAALKSAHEEHEDPEHSVQRAELSDPCLPYRVNVILDNSLSKPCPVVLETNPTYNNVFGSIERRVSRAGHTTTDFTKITAGSLLQADGGYLVLNAQDALSEAGIWKTLKRVLIHKELVIQGIEGLLQLSTVGLKPEPIHLDVTVILIGTPYLYFLLDSHDDDFRKIFKVRADFDHEMQLGKQSVEYYSRFVAQMTEREETLPFTAKAVARLMEHGVRLAGRRSRITSRFGEIADVVRESSFWASRDGREQVDEGAVEKALLERRERLSLIEEKIRDRVSDGLVLIDTEGERVGQANGLAVLTYGQHRFGVASRITASVAKGKDGIINVERESQLSGNTHDKGVLILSGFLREQFAQKVPLSLTASICFEQSYGGIDGDSASSTELYALLSALADVPIRQDVAITGSVNQKGDIQAIGGANEKVEGFFSLCAERGLTGRQSVLIPESNVKDLMLRSEVRDAVRKGRFHIYAVSRVEEGIEILTGVKSGSRNARGEWEKGTLFRKIQERLIKLNAVAARKLKSGSQRKKKKRKKG